jgi:glycosyltransferase involved in cell wall biosynthesis
MWSDLAAHSGPEREAEAETARMVEAMVFGGARKVVVTTPAMREYVLKHYTEEAGKVHVVPNYVLTDLFCPDEAAGAPVPGRLCFVGRLGPEKNVKALVRACAGLDVELVMIGQGPLKGEVEDLAREQRVRLKITAGLPHGELPRVMRQAEIFLLVSPHEGHPKALLEAMSTGKAVIGADSPGIRELIRHGETGWLCGTSPESIRAAIKQVLAQPELRKEMGRNAREYVRSHFSIDEVVKEELTVLQEAAGKGS